MSAPFPLQRAPDRDALFALAMEPIAEVCGLRVGWLEERVSLFADDLLLFFLNDAGASLQGALKIMDIFSTFTGQSELAQTPALPSG